MKGILRITYCVLFIALLLLATACQPAPKPTPEPAPLPTAELPTLPPVVTVPPAPATLTPIPTTTPLPYPSGTPEPFLPEGESAAEPRLGVAATLGKGVLFCDGRQWQWWWSASMANNPKDCEGAAVLPDHVPMLVWGPNSFEPQRVIQAAGKMSPDVWLVFNECDNNYQCNTSPEEAARYYHDVAAPFAYGLDPNAQLIVGGANGGRCGAQWLIDFVTYYRANYGDVPRAGWHFHPYAELWEGEVCDGTTEWNWPVLHDIDLLWNEWLDQTRYIQGFLLAYGREGDEVWFSEMGCLAPPPAVCRDDTYTLMYRQLAWFDGPGRWVTRYAWFADGGPGAADSWYWTDLWKGTHETSLELQPIGELWLNHEPLPAVSLRIYKRWFPIIGYAADVVPPRPEAAPVQPGPAYPGPEELHP